MALDPMLHNLLRFPPDRLPSLSCDTSIQHTLQAHLHQNPTIPASALIPEIMAGRHQLLPNAGPFASSVLSVLNNSVTRVFAQGLRAAGNLLTDHMIPMADDPKLKKMSTPTRRIYTKSCTGIWKDGEAAATLIAILAAPHERLPETTKFFENTPATVRDTASASLADAFKTAKAKAQGKERFTTVIVVSLLDLYMLEMEEMGLEDQCTSFGHDFVLGVGPEGVIIWQGTMRCAFDEYLAAGGAQVRSWMQAEEFIKDFGKLTDGRKGQFDAKRVKLYNKLFGVDFNKQCKEGWQPLVPKYNAWVKLMVLEDVVVEDIGKMAWVWPSMALM